MKLVFLNAMLMGYAVAQCPNTPSPHFMCTSSGGNTQITLFQNADLRWDGFNLQATETLEITSSGGVFSSQHIVNGPTRIAGQLTADGPVTILSNNVLCVDGMITAPEVTLSTLSVVGGAYVGTNRARSMIIDGTIIASSGNVTLLGNQQTISGTLEAPEGKVTMIAADSSTISQNDLMIMRAPSPQSSASVLTRGTVNAPVVEIYSDGFIANSGRIETFGPQSRVRLEAPGGISHRNAQGSIIIASQLQVIPNTILEGTVQDPNDGSNPGGVSTTVEFPDLAKGDFAGKRKTTLLPMQFSSSTVSQSRLPSVLKKKKQRKTTSSRLATRGSGSPKKVKKRSFFGLVTKK